MEKRYTMEGAKMTNLENYLKWRAEMEKQYGAIVYAKTGAK